MQLSKIRRFAFQCVVMMGAFFGCQTLTYAAQDNVFYVKEPVFDALVYMKEAGQEHAKTIVLVHGLGDLGSKDWDTVVPMLKHQYHVITFDLPGFGNSEKGNKLYSPTQYAKFLKWVVDTFAQEPVIMVGHSMGGAISLRYAAMYPETLSRLILVDAAGVLYRSAFGKETVKSRVGFGGWLGGWLSGGTEALGDMLSDWVIQADKIPIDLDMVLHSERLRSTVLAGNPSTIAAMALLEENYTYAIKNMNVPTRIIWGRDDKVAPLRTGRLLDARLASSSLDIIDHAGHTPMKDQEEIFNHLLLKNLTNTRVESTKKGSQRMVGVGSCDGKKGVVFSGRYQRIKIQNCDDVLLDGVTTQHLDIKGSHVEIYDTVIKSSGVAMVVEDSRVTATVLDIDGQEGILVSSSKLDLASVVINSRGKGIKASGKGMSKVVLSVSEINSSSSHGIKHGTYDITQGSSL